MAIPHGLGAAPNIRAVIAFASYQSATGVAGQKNTSVRMATGVATWDAGGVQQMAFGSANSRTESYNDALLHIPQDADSNGGYSGYRSIGLTVEPANPPDAVNIYVRLSRPYVPAENFLVHFLILYGAHISARAVPFLQAAGNNVAQTITGPAWTPTSAVSFTPPVISQEWGEGGGNAGDGLYRWRESGTCRRYSADGRTPDDESKRHQHDAIRGLEFQSARAHGVRVSFVHQRGRAAWDERDAA
jgi:hypothetical protein